MRDDKAHDNEVMGDALFFAVTAAGDLAVALAILLIAAMRARQRRAHSWTIRSLANSH